MLSHGINVVGLFFIAEIILDRMKTRNLSELGGIRLVAPAFATYFIIILLASVVFHLPMVSLEGILTVKRSVSIQYLDGRCSGSDNHFGSSIYAHSVSENFLGVTNHHTRKFCRLVTVRKMGAHSSGSNDL